MVHNGVSPEKEIKLGNQIKFFNSTPVNLSLEE